MDGLRRLLGDARLRLWLVTVFPTGLVFLGAAVLLRFAVRGRLASMALTGGPLAPEEAFDSVFSGGYILGGFALALLISTLLTLAAMRIAIHPLQELSKTAAEMARGNYSVRLRVRPRDSILTKGLTANVNALAESLERTERLRRDLAANLAHEIRTPLTNVQGYLEALRDGVLDPNQQALESIHDEVMRLVRLVDALHLLARADALRFQPLDVVPTALDYLSEQLVRVVTPLAEVKRIRLEVTLGAGSTQVEAHADSLAQVIRNLLRNAIQYAPEDGLVQVHTEVAGDRYRFTCSNSGPGIDPCDLPLIFQRFYRTDRSVGVGLGLAIVKELVEAHGGRVEAESRPGWTTFRFEVPLSQSKRAGLA